MKPAFKREFTELCRLIQSDKDTEKAFHVLVNLVGRNYPFYQYPERKVLERMASKNIHSLDEVKQFITNLYFSESHAGCCIRTVRGGVRG